MARGRERRGAKVAGGAGRLGCTVTAVWLALWDTSGNYCRRSREGVAEQAYPMRITDMVVVAVAGIDCAMIGR
jgi:hypothetical protein